MVNIANGNNSLAVFNPTPDLEKNRAVFLVWLEDNPIDKSNFRDKLKACFDVKTADRLAKLAEVNPEFTKWFLTGETEFRVRLKLLESKALSALEDVLANDDPKAASARVNAAKHILSLGGKTEKTMPQAKEKLEDAIAQMSEAELKMLIENADGSETTVEVKKKKKAEVIDV
jgi:hypothetical protein